MVGGKQLSPTRLRPSSLAPMVNSAPNKRSLSDANPGPSAPKQVKMAPIFGKEPPPKIPIEFFGKSMTDKGCCHFAFEDPKPSNKIAAFDMDGTLIVPKSGNKFPKDKEDWKLWSPEVKAKLRAVHDQGYSILLISNQAGNPKQQKSFQDKLPLLARHLDVPLRVFAALDRNIYRKPATGMWDVFVEKHNGGLEIDYENSFYVGDAAGRAADHADTDRKFAMNCNLPFFTPEEYFKGAAVSKSFTLSGFNSKLYDHSLPLFTPTSTPLLPRRDSEFDDEPLDVVIFVGSPGAGKTSFYAKHFQPKGYVHINQDTLRTRDACVRLLRETLSSPSPKSCIIDNTSPAAATRDVYLSILRSEFPKVKARCFLFTASKELCMHNSVYRASYEAVDPGNGKKRELLPQIAFENYVKGFQKPTLQEGFSEIKQIFFRFEGTPEQREKWERWLIDVYQVPKPKKMYGKR
ncbi:polynucleotide 3'-phosphatase [Sporobolomyces salmoneus]|uniref:polynucleotide 3'-phosphatase n=1 Tax=Sporobolomyces salmoneus TaxID=183962 RepID=UPI00317422C6